MAACSSSEGPTCRRTKSSKGSSALGSDGWMLVAHGGLLSCPALRTERVGRPPRSVIGPESLAARVRLPPSVRTPERPLSRVASPKRYVGLRVSRGELLLRRPLACVLRGLWRSGSNGVFSCATHYTAPTPRPLVEPSDLLASPPGSATGAGGRGAPPAARPRWTTVTSSPSSSCASASTKPSPMPRSRMGEKLPLVRMPTRSCPRHTSAPSRSGCRPSATKPRRRRAGPFDPFLFERGPAGELSLVPADDPAQPGLERGDARAELVAVQRQARLEAQRVARARARPGRRPGRGRPPRSPARPRPAPRTRRRPHPCSRCPRPGTSLHPIRSARR